MRSPATTWAVLGLFPRLLPLGFARFKIIPARRSFLRFPDEIIPHLINLLARKFHLRFSLIFPLLKTIPSLIPVKEKRVWVMAVRLVDPCQFTPREGSDRLFGFVIWVVIELPAGLYWSWQPSAREAVWGCGGAGGSQQSPRAGGQRGQGAAEAGKRFAVLCPLIRNQSEVITPVITVKPVTRKLEIVGKRGQLG